MLKAVAFGLFLACSLSGGATALQCGSPTRERAKQWLENEIQQGKLLLRATAEYVTIVKGNRNSDWLELLIVTRPAQVSGLAQADSLPDNDNKIYIRFDLVIEGNRRDVISDVSNSEWVAKLPSLWLVTLPKDYEVHGEIFRVVESNSCWAMSIDGLSRTAPRALEELNWETISGRKP